MDLFASVLHFISPSPENTFEILLILMVVIWSAGRIFSLMQLPAVLGEILAGILIGPHVLNLVPETEAVKILAELGIFFIMFHAGLTTNPKELIKSSKTSVAVAIGGVSLLFALGFFTMQIFDFPFISSLFMGAVISVSSFPVITRILKHQKILNTKMGHTVLGAAVIVDMIAFILITIIVGIAESGSFSYLQLILLIVKVLFFVTGTLFLGFKILPHFAKILTRTGTKGFTFSLIVALIFGLFAELIGLHIILGAYLGGIFVRQEIQNSSVYNKIEDRYFGIAHSFLGPIFFASIGMTVSFSSLSSNLPLILSLIAIILIGQWIGSGGMAYIFGSFSAREASALAFALSGRGVMEIIFAKIGYETIIRFEGSTQRLISNELFSSIIVIALIITFIIPFLLRFLIRPYQEQHLK